MSKTKLDWDVIGQFGIFSILAGFVGTIVMVLSNNMKNANAAVQAAAAIAMLMPSIALAMGIVSKMDVKFDLGIAGQFAIFEVLVGALGIVLIGLAKLNDIANTDVTRIIPLISMIVVLLPVLSTVTSGMALVGNVVKGSLGAVAELSAGMAIVFAVIATLITGFAYLANEFDAIGNALEVAPHYCLLLGEAIGNLVGGIAGALITNVGGALIDLIPKLGTALGDFVKNIGSGFFDTLRDIDDSVVQGAANFALVMIALGAGELVGAVGTLVGGVFNKLSQALGIDTDLKKKFKYIGGAIKAFAKEVDGIDANKVKTAAEAAQILSAVEKNLPAMGGKLQAWLGEKDIGDFGERLKPLGEGIRMFAEETGDINPEQIQAAADAARILVELEQGVPAQGGKLQAFLGSKDIGAFGERLKSFGTSLKEFAAEVVDIKKSSVQGAAAAAEILIKLEDDIVPADGALQSFLGHQSFAQFGERLTALGTSLVTYIDTTKGITEADVTGSAAAISALAAIEKELKVTGGAGALLFGDASFSSFAKNLEDLGKALDTYDVYIDNVDFTQFDKMTEALRSLVSLTDEVQNVGSWSTELKTALSNWIVIIGQDISSQADKLKSYGSEVVTNLLRGISEGIDAKKIWMKGYVTRLVTIIKDEFTDQLKIKGDYSEVMKQNGEFIVAGLVKALNDPAQVDSAKNAAKNLAKAVDEAFRTESEIASPSAVMQENGVWLVKGLAEGIKKDTSAEEAMAKKAQNIAAAFKDAISKMDIFKERDQLSFQLWEANEGRGATDAEKQQRNIEAMANELEYMAKEVQTYRAALATTAKEFGEGSEQYIQAENTMNQALLKMYQQRNKIEQAQAELASMKAQGSGQQKAEAYRKFMEDEANQKTAEMLGYTDEQFKAWAQEETGYIPKEKMANIAKDINLAEIMAPAFSDQQIEIATDAISKAVSKTVGGAVDAGLTEVKLPGNPANKIGEWLDEGIENGISENLDKPIKAIFDAGAKILNAGMKVFEEHSPSRATYEQGYYLSVGLSNGIRNNASIPVTATQTTAKQVLNALNSTNPEFSTIGQQAMVGFAKGIQSASQAAIQAAQAVANKVTSTIKAALQVASPSRVTAQIGEYVSLGLAKGIADNAGAVTNASEDLANNTITMLDYAKSAIDDVLSTDDDFEPVITPVLDMDDLKKQAREIPGIINRQNGISTRFADIAAQNVSSRRREISEPKTEQRPEENITNINYTQNNYSPKALNRRDIYRQTNNQISQLKGVLRRR